MSAVSGPEIVNILRAILDTTGKEDNAGREMVTSLFGDRHSATRRNQISLTFEYSLSDFQVDEDNLLTGDVIQEASQAEIQSGTASGARGRLQSKNETRYIPGLELYTIFSCRFDPPQEGNQQRIGLYDGNSGFSIGFDFDGEFSVFDRSNGTDRVIGRGNFTEDELTGDGESVFNHDPTQFNLYRVVSGSLGATPIYFDVYSGFERGWVTYHIRNLTDIQRDVTVPNLPIRIESVNNQEIDETSDIEVVFASAGLTGQERSSPSDRPFTAERTPFNMSSGSLRNIVTIRSKDQFQNKVNRIKAVVKILTMSSEGNKVVRFKLIKDATLGGSPTFNDIDSDDSIMEFSTSSVGVSGGSVQYPIQLQKADARSVELPGEDETGTVDVFRGESLTLAAISSSTSEVAGAMRWTELF